MTGPPGSSPPGFFGRARETIAGSHGVPPWTEGKIMTGIGLPCWSPPGNPSALWMTLHEMIDRARESISAAWGAPASDTGPPGTNMCAKQEIPTMENVRRDFDEAWRSNTSTTQRFVGFELRDEKKFSEENLRYSFFFSNRQSTDECDCAELEANAFFMMRIRKRKEQPVERFRSNHFHRE